MNIDKLLTNPFETSVQNYVIALRKNFKLCGSRYVLDSEELSKDTDWDFYGIATPDTEVLLEVMGFYKKYIPEDYVDNSTDSVWCVNNGQGLPLPIQVVLKKPEYSSKLEYFWRHLKNNPRTYKEVFWKSYEVDGVKPNTQDSVRGHINHWMKYVIGVYYE